MDILLNGMDEMQLRLKKSLEAKEMYKL